MRKLVWLTLIMVIFFAYMLVAINVNASAPIAIPLQTQLASSPTPVPTPTPDPTLTPTPKVQPGSPLSLGGQSFAETVSQFDLTEVAKIVLVILGIIWTIVILVYVDREFGRKKQETVP